MTDSWWRRGVMYEVYVRSFADADGDGVGDLAGIRDRLHYLDWLGIDGIWITPIYPSPMADFGYDVADYTGVDPLFGSLADVDRLIEDLHRRGMHLILDFVPNHTSDRHPWFVDARSSREAEHRDWYIWRDPRPDGSPPNNWQSVFGGDAWEWDEPTGQYYFHSFLKEQPDLDWTNPAVRAAMTDAMRYWFERGVDGLRLDVVHLLSKRNELRQVHAGEEIDRRVGADPERSARARRRQLWGDGPQIHEIMRLLRRTADEFDAKVLVGEIWLPPKRLVAYYGEELTGLHLPFNFQLINLAWDPHRVHQAVVRYETLLPDGAWPNWVLGNHDVSRVASRLGAAQARVAAMLLLTLRGTPTLYYGDEIGMSDVELPPSAQRDPQGLREAGMSRDMARTPMRWQPGPTAGFTSGQPWLPVGPAVGEINVEAERDDPDSVLSLHRRLLDLRRRERALHSGAWQDLGRAGSALAYLRTDGERRYLIALNLAGGPASLPAATLDMRGRIEVATSHQREGERFEPDAALAGDEGLVVRLERGDRPRPRR